MPCEAFQPPSGGPRGSDRQMQQCHPRTDLESRASTLGCKRVAVGIPWQGGSRMRAAVDPGLAPRRRGCNGADHRGEPCGGPNRSASPSWRPRTPFRTGLYGRSGWSLRRFHPTRRGGRCERSTRSQRRRSPRPSRSARRAGWRPARRRPPARPPPRSRAPPRRRPCRPRPRPPGWRVPCRQPPQAPAAARVIPAVPADDAPIVLLLAVGRVLHTKTIRPRHSTRLMITPALRMALEILEQVDERDQVGGDGSVEVVGEGGIARAHPLHPVEQVGMVGVKPAEQAGNDLEVGVVVGVHHDVAQRLLEAAQRRAPATAAAPYPPPASWPRTRAPGPAAALCGSSRHRSGVEQRQAYPPAPEAPSQPAGQAACYGGVWGSVLRSFGSSFVRLRVHRSGSRRSDRSVSLARSAAYSWAVRRSRPPRPGPWIGASLALSVEVSGLAVRWVVNR